MTSGPINEQTPAEPDAARRDFGVDLRFYEELNEFLPHHHRRQTFTVRCPDSRSVKDLIESQGVPHTEVDLILVDGESVGFDRLIDKSARISVYPVFESLDVSNVSRLDRLPLRELRFIADVHLGKLVRRLRLLGFDCVYNQSWDDDVLARKSAAEKRVLLTRDRGLLKRAIVTHGVCLHSDQPNEQIREVVRRLDLRSSARPFARCVHCNGLLAATSKENVRERVPSRTLRYVDDYLLCNGCGKVYWRGTHWHRLEHLVKDALQTEMDVR